MPEDNVSYLATQVCRRRRPVNWSAADDDLFSAEYLRTIGPSGCESLDHGRIIGSTLVSRLTEAADSGRLFSRHGLRQRGRRLLARALPRFQVDSGTWVIDDWTHGYFHWLTEGLTRVELALDEGATDEVLLPRSYEGYRYIGDSLRYLRLPFRYLPGYRLTTVARLALPHSEVVTGNYNCDLIRRVGARLRRSLPREQTDQAGAPHRLWISRARAGKRQIVNEAELRPILEKHGFRIVHPEALSFSEQAALFSQATLIAGLHGAGLTNMLFAPPKARILEIRRAGDTHSNCYFALASSLKLDYYYLLATPGNSDPHAGDCHLAPDSLQRLLEDHGGL